MLLDTSNKQSEEEIKKALKLTIAPIKLSGNKFNQVGERFLHLKLQSVTERNQRKPK